MGRQGVLLLALGVAIGASVVLGSWVTYLVVNPSQVSGGGYDTNGTMSVATGLIKGQGQSEALFIFDHEARKLVVYFVNGRNLEILAVRDCTYDLGFQHAQWSPEGGRQRPDVGYMKAGGKKK